MCSSSIWLSTAKRTLTHLRRCGTWIGCSILSCPNYHHQPFCLWRRFEHAIATTTTVTATVINCSKAAWTSIALQLNSQYILHQCGMFPGIIHAYNQLSLLPQAQTDQQHDHGHSSSQVRPMKPPNPVLACRMVQSAVDDSGH